MGVRGTCLCQEGIVKPLLTKPVKRVSVHEQGAKRIASVRFYKHSSAKRRNIMAAKTAGTKKASEAAVKEEKAKTTKKAATTAKTKTAAKTGTATKAKTTNQAGTAAKAKTTKAATGTKAKAAKKTAAAAPVIIDKKAGPFTICLDVGGTKVLGVIFDKNDQIVYRLKKRSTEGGSGAQDVEKVIVDVVNEMLKASGIKKQQVRAVASCAPGVIDQENGIVLFTPNLPWRNYNMKQSMEEKLGLPFFVGNDVNLGVLGEYKFGVARGYNDVVGLFVGTGMGGGLILDGKLYTGNQFKGAECGHMVLDPEGPLCNCGQRGCLEAFSSKQGMSAYIRTQVSRGRESMMAEVVSEGVFRSKALKKALAANDAVAVEAVDRACHYLAVAIGSLINIFSPQLVILGGGVIEAEGDLFLQKVLAEVDRYCMPSIRTSVEIKNASLGDDSVVYGALALAEEHLK